jgi:alcohol dehydrogenase YqhD (iron-dependent ADH family)
VRDFSWIVPTRFVFGKDAEKEVGQWASSMNYKKVLVVYGGGHVVKSGLLKKVLYAIETSGIAHIEMGGVRPNPEITVVRQGVELARSNNVDLIIAVGGGSVIDCSKAIAIGAKLTCDVWNVFDPSKHMQFSNALPIAVILTIPASGSESSDSCVISNDEVGLKSAITSDLIRAQVAFMDPVLTMSLPSWQTFSGITDICAHIMERYFSCSEDVISTDSIALALLRSVRSEALKLIRDPTDYDARANIMWLGTLAHNGLAGIGREEDWGSHALEHELSAVKPTVTHGAGLAVIFPAWMRYVCDANPRRFIDFGRGVFGFVPTGDDLADASSVIDIVQKFFISLGMPQYLDEFGFVHTDIDKFIIGLHENQGKSFGSFKILNMEDARMIYKSAFKS